MRLKWGESSSVSQFGFYFSNEPSSCLLSPDCCLSTVLSELCERLSRGRHLRFQSATFQPITTPRWARSAPERASPWAWTWVSPHRPTPRSSWVRFSDPSHLSSSSSALWRSNQNYNVEAPDCKSPIVVYSLRSYVHEIYVSYEIFWFAQFFF